MTKVTSAFQGSQGAGVVGLGSNPQRIGEVGPDCPDGVKAGWGRSLRGHPRLAGGTFRRPLSVWGTSDCVVPFTGTFLVSRPLSFLRLAG